MKKKNSIFRFFSVLLLGISVFSLPLFSNEKVEPAFGYTNNDADTYYNSINDSLTGDDLLAQLRTLNSNRRKKTVGYKAMGTSASGQFKYTDYDPSTVKYDGSGQPYGTKVLSFYSGTPTTSFNREHTWPNSHGGNLIEGDIHMTRPTIASENGSRGNSFYVEGMKSSSNGWDPAAESFGEETYRGDAARIIFYGVVASSQLSLIDQNYHATSNNNRDNLMGKLSDLIKWHLKYGIQQREMNRNEGAEYLQGNRNPFIDHPEYVCRVWGNTNATTKALCANDPYTVERIAPTSFDIDVSKTEITVGDSLDLNIKNVVPSDAYKAVTWTSSNTAIATINDDTLKAVKPGEVTVTATSVVDKTIKSSVKITVKDLEPIPLQDVNVSISKTELEINESININAKTVPELTRPTATITYSSSDETVAKVTSSGMVTALKDGTAIITVKAQQGETVKTKDLSITVVAPTPSITINYPKYIMMVNNTFQLGVTLKYLPENTEIEWSSSDEARASVSNTGLVTAISPGTVIITAKVKDMDLIATSQIKIISEDGSFIEDDNTSDENKGCQGNIATSSIIISTVSLTLICLLIIKKKKFN